MVTQLTKKDNIIMSAKNKYLLASTAIAIISTLIWSETSFGATVEKKTVTDSETATSVTTIDNEGNTSTRTYWKSNPTGGYNINLNQFDLNGDNMLSTNEIAEMLFKLYDTDNNGLIDNNEYNVRYNVDVMPTKQNTVITYDFNDDGKIDETKYTYETILKDTMLSRFDTNKNGLSAYDFTGDEFYAVDINKDKGIDLKEWQGTYITSIDRENKAKASNRR